MSTRNTVKVTVNLPADEAEALKGLAQEQSITMTDALRKALVTERFFRENTRDGSKILLQHPDSSYERVILR